MEERKTTSAASAEERELGPDQLWQEYLDITLNSKGDTTERQREIFQEIMERDFDRIDHNRSRWSDRDREIEFER